MAAQWPQQYQQPPTPGYGYGPYQQQYPQQQAQQPHPQYAYGQQQAGQSYVQQAYAQPPPVQQQHAQQQSDQQAQYQQPPTASEAAQQQHQQSYAPPRLAPQMHGYGSGQRPQPQQQATYQPYGTPTQTTPAVQPAQPSHNSCFNCGSADHWAQSCPEPKKESGSLDHQSSAPPAKRQKFNAPVVTKYPVPPHVAQAQAAQQQAAQQAWRPPGYGQLGLLQYPTQQQRSYAPPTPMSAQSPPNGQWPQNTQYPQYQQGPQPGYAYQQTGPYPQYPYTPTSQIPAQYYGPHPPTQMSPTGHQGSPAQSQHTQNAQPQVAKVPPYSSASPHLATSSLTKAQHTQYPYSQGVATVNVYQGIPSANHSTHSQSSTPMQHPAQAVSAEPEEDDLGKLDVPDVPSAEGCTTATLVGRPLPTNFVVADALAPFAPPALGDNGLCKSKYLDRADDNHEVANVKETNDWNNYKKDPIFACLSDGGKLVSLREIDAMYRPHRIERELSQGLDSDWEPEYRKDHRVYYSDDRDVMNSLENALGASRNQPPADEERKLRPRKRTFSQSREDDLYEREPEDSFTRRGMTGDPMRAKAPVRPCPPPTPQERYEENGHDFRFRSASPRRYDSGSHQYVSPPDSGFDGPSHSGRSKPYQRDSHHSQDPSRRLGDKPHSEQFDPPPPPPPPPMRKPSWYDGPSGSPLSAALATGNPFEPDGEDSMQNGNSNPENGHIANVPVVSPLKLRSERSYVRKRESIRDDSSDENETPGRRQADDITPKLKRRQPKVAAAYSRRW